MRRYVVVSFASGILFAVLDGLISANPIAQNLYSVYKPIARTSVNAPVGVLIDLIYGFVLGAIFLCLYAALPGKTGLVKGMSYGLLLWFLRVAMGVASTWMMFEVPLFALAYTLFTGLGEMLVLGVLYGRTLRPTA